MTEKTPRDYSGDLPRSLLSPPRHIAAAMKAEASEKRAKEHADRAEREAKRTQPRVVVLGGSSQRRERTRFTVQLREQYLQLLSEAVPKHEAARRLGTTSRAVRDAQRADPEFAEDCRDAQEAAMEPVFEAQYRNALAGDWKAADWVGRVLAGHIYNPDKKTVVEVSGQIESIDGGDRATRVERIRQLEGRLAERLALRAAGDDIAETLTSSDVEDAEVVDEP